MKTSALFRIRLATAALVVATSLGVPALAGTARADGGGMPCAQHGAMDPVAHVAKLAPLLGLSAKQQAAATKVAQEIAAKAEPIVRQADALHEEIRALVESSRPDAAQIGHKVIAMHANHQRLEALHQQGRTRLEALLTADQRARLAKLHADKGAMHGIHGRGHGPDAAAADDE